MLTMSGIWDQTAEVLRGRAGILARIAVPTLFLPSLIRDGWTALHAAPGTAPGLAVDGVGIVLAFAALLLTVWGQMAITAVATDPATTAGDAAAQANRRFGPALGIYAVALLVVLVLAIPIGVALAGTHVDMAAMSRGVAPNIAPGTVGFLLLYGLALMVAAIIVSARLFLLTPVIANERAGLRSFARSWAMTRGLAWRIIGIVLLFGLVWGIAQSAATLVVGIVVRLVAGGGPGAAVPMAVAVTGAVLTTIYLVVVAAFAAQLYAALSGRKVADVFA